MNTKIILIAALALGSLQTRAQQMTVTANKTTFGIRAGVNFQNINGKNESDDKLENDLTAGFHAGVNAEIPVGTGTYIQPGVIYSMKGAKNFEYRNNATVDKVKLSYIEIPVNFLYKPVLGTGNMLLGFGPYVGFGIGGKVENGSNEADIEFESSRSSTTTVPNQFKRVDGGANFLAGYEFSNKLSFQLNAQLGLIDINPELSGASSDKTNWRNTGWGLSVGYRF